MQNIAQAWLVYRLTDSSVLLGLTSFFSQVPILLFAPLGGAVADQHNRRHILLMTQGASLLLALILALLTLNNWITVWEIFIISALLGCVNGFDIPARQSFIVELVGHEDLPNAIALNSSMFNGARLVGPAIAGIMVSLVGEGWCFLMNAISFLAVIVALSSIKLPPRSISKSMSNMLTHMQEGIVYASQTTPIKAILLLLGLSSLTGMSYVVLMPIFARAILHGDSKTLGILMSSAGLGALSAALTLATRSSVRDMHHWITWGSFGFGMSLVLFAFSTEIWLSSILLVIVGYSMMIQMASSNTLIQSMVHDNFRGRVMSFYSMMFMGISPFGALLAGIIANHLGASLTVAIEGAICIAGALFFRHQLPKFISQIRDLLDKKESA
jgi:MFS family permease